MHRLQNAVRIWRIDLDRYGSEVLMDGFPDGVLRRASRILEAGERRRFLAGRHVLATLLATDSGCPRMGLEIVDGANGKPFAPGLSRRFNLSRSRGVALVAIATIEETEDTGRLADTGRAMRSDDPSRGAIGVDFEPIHSVQEREALVRSQFHPDELARWAGVPHHRRDERFLRCWTRKEAVAKALGSGIGTSFSAFPVGWDGRIVDLDVTVERRSTRARVVDVDLPPGEMGAVAMIGAPRERPGATQCS